jgi:hypothetical protein
MGQDTLNLRPLIHLKEGPLDDTGHKKNMGHTVSLEHIGEKARTCHFGHGKTPQKSELLKRKINS